MSSFFRSNRRAAKVNRRKPQSLERATRRRTFFEKLEDRSLMATLTWVGDVDAAWNGGTSGVNTNWSTNTLPASGDTLIFPAGAANLTNTNNTTAGNSYILQITGGAYNISGNAIALNEAGDDIVVTGGTASQILSTPLILNAAGSSISVSGQSLTYNTGAITGPGTLTKTGTSDLILGTAPAAANTMTAVNISQGRLFFNSNSTNYFGATAPITVSANATLSYNSNAADFTLPNPITIQNDGNLSSRRTSGTLTLSGAVTLPTSGRTFFNLDDASTGTITMNNAANAVAATGDLTYQVGLRGFETNFTQTNNIGVGAVNLNHLISGNVNFTKTGGGTLALTNAGAYTFGGAGRTIDIQGGNLSVDKDNDLGDAANTITFSNARTAAINTVSYADPGGGSVLNKWFDFKTGVTDLSALWTGSFTPAVNGVHTLGTSSDDGSMFYLDFDLDGDFETGERVVNNNGSQGQTTVTGNTPALTAGTAYPVAIVFFQGAGGGGLEAKWAAGASVAFASLAHVNPSDGAQAGRWSSFYGANTLEERAYDGTPGRDFLDNSPPQVANAGLDDDGLSRSLLNQAPVATGELLVTATFSTARNFILNAQGGINVSTGTFTITGLVSGANFGAGMGADAYNGLNGGLTKLGGAELILSNTGNSYFGPTVARAGQLTVADIANGGASSTLGQSSSAAANLWLDGGTLRYNGPAADSTDRNFTLTTNSGTIENNSPLATSTLTIASTSAPRLFTYGGDIGIAAGETPPYVPPVGGRTLTLTGTNVGANTFAGQIVNDVNTVPSIGATTLTKAGAGTWVITNNANSFTGVTNVNAGTLRITQDNALGSAAAGTSVAAGATLELNGGLTLPAEPILINGTGVGGVGALNATGNVTVPGRVGLAGNTSLGATSGNALNLTGPFHKEVPANLTFVGAGSVAVSGAIGDADYTLTPFTAKKYEGVNQNIADATVITNDFNNTTVASFTNAAFNAALTFANAAAFNAVWPGATGVDTFTTVFHATLTVNTPGTYSFAGTNNDDGAAVWIKPAANASFVAGDLLQGIVANNNTTIATRVLTAGTYTLLYAHREGTGGEAFTGRIQGPILVGQTNATLLATVNPAATTSGTNNVIVNSTGTVTLSGANTYSGSTTVNSGTLIAANNSALGATGSGTVVNTGATLSLSGGVTIPAGEAIAIAGTGVGGNGALRNLAGNNTLSGNLAAVGYASEIRVGSAVAGDLLTISGNIDLKAASLSTTGAGDITVNGVIDRSTVLTYQQEILVDAPRGYWTLDDAIGSTVALNSGTTGATANGATGVTKNYNIQRYFTDTENYISYRRNDYAGHGTGQIAAEAIDGGGPGDQAGGVTSDDQSIRARAFVRFNTAGTYTIAAGSDDGRLLRLTEASPGSAPGYSGFTAFGDQNDPGNNVSGRLILYNATTGHNHTTGQFTVAAGDILLVESFFHERAAGGGSFDIVIINTADLTDPTLADGWQLLQDQDLVGSTAPNFPIDISSVPFTGPGDSGNGRFNVQRFDINVGAGDTDLDTPLETQRIWSYIDANPGIFPVAGTVAGPIAVNNLNVEFGSAPALAVGNSARFDGSATDNISTEINTVNGFMDNMSAFTMNGWIRSYDRTVTGQDLWGQNDAIEFFFASDTSLQLFTEGPGTSITVDLTTAPVNIRDGNWHMITAVGTGTERRIYFDGQLVASATHAALGANGYGDSPGEEFAIGADVRDGNSNGFTGDIDEVSVYNTALSAARILELYNAQNNVGGFNDSVTVMGTGTVTLAGANLYNGPTTVNAGTLSVTGSLANGTGNPDVIVNNGGTLGGTGTVSGTVSVQSGGAIAPGTSPGILTTGNVTFATGAPASNFNIEINGTVVGTGYDQLNVTGTVALGTTTNLNVSGTLIPTPGTLQQFIIINNDGTDAVTGTFAGLPETSFVMLGGQKLYVSYNGGDGNDVVLSSQPIISGTGAADSIVVRQRVFGGSTDADLEYSLNAGPFVAINAATGFVFNGLDGADTMTVDFVNGDAVPAGGVNMIGGGPTVGPGDLLVVDGKSLGNNAAYTPHATITGDGSIALSGVSNGVITFSGLEPVDITGMASASFVAPSTTTIATIANGNDFATNLIPAIRVTGTSNAVAFESVAFWNNSTVTIDTATNGGAGVDTLTVTSANNAHNNLNLTLNTGGGTDRLNLNGGINTDGNLILTAVEGVVLGANVTIDSEQGNNNNAGNVDFGTAVTSASAAGFDLTILANVTAGVFNGGNVTLGAFSNAAPGAAFVNDLTINTAGVGGGTAGLTTLNAGIQLDENGGADPADFLIQGSGKIAIAAPAGTVTIGTDSGNNGLTVANSINWGTSNIYAVNAGVTLAFNAKNANPTGGNPVPTATIGLVDNNAGANQFLTSITFFMGNLANNSSSVTFNGSVFVNGGNITGTLTSANFTTSLTLDTAQGATATGGNISFSNSNGVAAGANADLVFDTSAVTTGGNISFTNLNNGGPANSLNDLTLNTNGGTTDGTITISGNINLDNNGADTGDFLVLGGGRVILGAAVTIDTEIGNTGAGGSINFGTSPVVGNAVGRDLNLNTSTTFAGANGGAVTLAAFTNTSGQFVNDLTVTTTAGAGGTAGVTTITANISLDNNGADAADPGAFTIAGGGAIVIGPAAAGLITIDTEQGAAPGDGDGGAVNWGSSPISANGIGRDLTINTKGRIAGGAITVGAFNNAAGGYLNDVLFDTTRNDLTIAGTVGTITLNGNILLDDNGVADPASLGIEGNGGAAPAFVNSQVVVGVASLLIDTEQGNDAPGGSFNIPSNTAAVQLTSTVAGRDVTIDTSTTAAGQNGGAISMPTTNSAGGQFLNDILLNTAAGAGGTAGALTIRDVLLNDNALDAASLTVQGGGNILINSSRTIDTENGNNGPGGAVDFGTSSVSANGTAIDLTIDTSSTGAGQSGGAINLFTFNNANGQFLNDLTITKSAGAGGTPGVLTLNGNLTFANNASETADFTVNGGGGIAIATTLTIDTEDNNNPGAGAVNFGATSVLYASNPGVALTIDTRGTTNGGVVTLGLVGDNAGANNFLTGLSIDTQATSSGEILMNANISTDGAISFNRRIVANASVVVDSTQSAGPGNPITFSGVLYANGAGRDVTLDTSTTAAGQNGGAIILPELGVDPISTAGRTFLNDFTINTASGAGGTAGSLTLRSGVFNLDDNGAADPGSFTLSGNGNLILGAPITTGSTVTINPEQGNTAGIPASNVNLNLSNVSAVNPGVDFVIDSTNTGAGSIGGAITFGGANNAAGNLINDLTLTATGPGTSDDYGDVVIGGAVTLATNAGDTGALTITGGDVTQNAAAAIVTTGPISVTARQTVALNSSANAGADTITILANQDGAGAESLTMAAGASLTTTNGTAAAIAITVNTATGTGSANLSAVSAGVATGVITVDANGGAITDVNAAAVNLTSFAADLNGDGGIDLDTTISEVTAASLNSAVTIRETNGLAVNTVNAGTGTVTLTLAAGAITDNNTAGTLNVTAGLLDATGPAGIDLDTDIATLTGATTNADIVIREASAVAVNLLSAGTGMVSLSAGGAVTDNNAGANNVTAASLLLVANGGIDLDTTVGQLAASNATSGDILITNTGALNITTLSEPSIGSVSGVLNPAGAVTVVALSPLTVSSPVSALGAVVLTATDSAAAGDDLNVNATVTSTGSSVTLNSGDNATINATLTANTTTAINIDAGDLDPLVGATLNIPTGVVITATSATFTGGTQADAFNFAPQVTTPINVFGLAPVANPGGDTMLLDTAAPVTNPTLNILGGQGAGLYTFGNRANVQYSSIENATTTTPIHIALDSAATLIDNIRLQRSNEAAIGADFEVYNTDTTDLLYAGPIVNVLSFTFVGSANANTVAIDDINGLVDLAGTVPAPTGVGDNGNVIGTPEIFLRGNGGTDAIVFANTANATDQIYGFGTGAGPGSQAGEVYTTNGPRTLSVYFDGMEGVTSNDATPADVGTLTIVGDANANVISLTSSAGGTTVGATGYVPFTFAPQAFNAAIVNAGDNNDSLTLVSLNAAESGLALSLNGEIGNDTITVESAAAANTLALQGGVGNDAYHLGGSTNTVDGILAPIVIVDSSGTADSLTLVDSADLSGDTVSITDSTIDGVNGAPSPNVSFSSIEALDVTTSGGGDTITTTLTGVGTLVTVNVRGAGGDDDFFLNTADGMTTLTTINLIGEAGSDDFGSAMAPIRPLAGPATNVFVYGDTTAITTNPGGAITDRLFLDMTTTSAGMPTQPLVIVDTVTGQATTANTRLLRFGGIDDIDLYDGGVLTDVAIGDLYLRATNGVDNLIFYRENGGVFVKRNGVPVNTIPYAPTNRIVSYGRAGNDYMEFNFTLGNTLSADFRGEDDNDTLVGGLGGDLLVGGQGNDNLKGGEGADTLYGEDQFLTTSPIPFDVQRATGVVLSAGGGNDTLDGGGGNDFVFGGTGDDNLNGGLGNDYVHGGDGNDTLNSGGGNDILRGEAGADLLNGDTGNDILLGGANDDRLFGRGNRDFMLAGAGADQIQDTESSDDVTVAGGLTFDADNSFAQPGASLTGLNDFDLALQAMMFTGPNAWSGNALWAPRVANVAPLTAIINDTVVDIILGNTAGQDYIISNTNDMRLNTTGDLLVTV